MLDQQFLLEREDARDAGMRRREDERDKEVERRYREAEQTASERHKELMDQTETAHKEEIKWLGKRVLAAVVIVTLVGAIIGAGWWTPPWVDQEPERVIVVTPTPIPPTPPSADKP